MRYLFLRKLNVDNGTVYILYSGAFARVAVDLPLRQMTKVCQPSRTLHKKKYECDAYFGDV